MRDAVYQLPGAHPRSRGENLSLALMVPSAAGSSPLTRGKLHLPTIRLGIPGLIPAHAGKTVRVWRAPLALAGSSPLTRGKLESMRAHPMGSRLIPAHAGKTHNQGAITRVLPAHPRSRGENSIEETTGALAAGSSPLTRGKQDAAHAHIMARRLIPAHAGKTMSS